MKQVYPRKFLSLAVLLSVALIFSLGCKEERNSRRDRDRDKKEEQSSTTEELTDELAKNSAQVLSNLLTSQKRPTIKPEDTPSTPSTPSTPHEAEPPKPSPGVSPTLPYNMLGKWKPTKESFREIMEGEDIPLEAIDELAEGATVELIPGIIFFHQEFQGETNKDSKPYRVVSSTSEKTVLEITEPDGSTSISILSRVGDSLTIVEGEDTIRFTKVAPGEAKADYAPPPIPTPPIPTPAAATATIPGNMLGKWKPTRESFEKIMEGEDIPAEAITQLAEGSTVEITGEKIIFHQEFQGETNKDSKPYVVLSSTTETAVLEISEPDGSTSTSILSRVGEKLIIVEGTDTIEFTRR